ncbi:MAG TPA: T9SS type A sorting domain-containing protein, partial [Bacteroidetes bacterium]|nr:T9SS type A sorting domain-containing protein [Bacteroidota bacterium]
YIDYWGEYYPNACVPTGSIQNEENDFKSIYVNMHSKTTGVYPTVVIDNINIAYSKEIKNIDVISMNGNIVKKYKIHNVYSGTYSLSELKSGMYIVRITTVDNTMKNHKIFKE